MNLFQAEFFLQFNEFNLQCRQCLATVSSKTLIRFVRLPVRFGLVIGTRNQDIEIWLFPSLSFTIADFISDLRYASGLVVLLTNGIWVSTFVLHLGKLSKQNRNKGCASFACLDELR